jgi:hypothetical protein
MSSINAKALRCVLSRGAFSDERIIRIKLPEGEYVGVASRRYCWGKGDKPLDENEPPAGKAIEGKVAARVIEMDGEENVHVSVPDGTVLTVPADLLLERPSEVQAHVPV